VRAHWLSKRRVRENDGVLPIRAIFLVLAFFLWWCLSLNPREVPSPLIGKPAPAFTVPLLSDGTIQ
jgi:hypothetical protein